MFSNQMKLLFLVVFFSLAICANGQKKRVKENATPPKPPPVKKSSAEKTNTVVNYTAYIDVSDKSEFKVTFAAANNGQSNFDQIFWIENLFSSLNSKNQKTNLTEIIVRPSMELSFGKLTEVLKKIRNSANQTIRVQLDNDVLAEISKPLPKTVKPNPLFLLVKLEADGKVSINNESLGSIDDMSQLQNLLAKIFDERINNGVFREGTNEVDKEVFLTIPNTFNLLALKKLARGVRDSGAYPISLQIDESVMIMQIEAIEK